MAVSMHFKGQAQTGASCRPIMLYVSYSNKEMCLVSALFGKVSTSDVLKSSCRQPTQDRAFIQSIRARANQVEVRKIRDGNRRY